MRCDGSCSDDAGSRRYARDERRGATEGAQTADVPARIRQARSCTSACNRRSPNPGSIGNGSSSTIVRATIHSASPQKWRTGIRGSGRFGSRAISVLIRCGLEHARGDSAIAMASDLQDPPETIPELLARWAEGHHVVWAVRASREGESRRFSEAPPRAHARGLIMLEFPMV
jgi:hypothetical protein